MNQEKLIRKLNSVGKQVFVEQFELFEKYYKSEISRENAIDELVSLGISNESGAGIRIGNAKLIFQASKEQSALDIILNSNRISSSIMTRAKNLKL